MRAGGVITGDLLKRITACLLLVERGDEGGGAVLQKPRNVGPFKSRQRPYLQIVSPTCLNCLQIWRNILQIWQNCLQIWLLSGIVGSSIPGFLQNWGEGTLSRGNVFFSTTFFISTIQYLKMLSDKKLFFVLLFCKKLLFPELKYHFWFNRRCS